MSGIKSKIAMTLTAMMFALCLCYTGYADSSSEKKVKGDAKGVFSLIPGDRLDQEITLEGRASWENPNITGLILRTFWNKVEQEEGQYDFSYFDAGFALAHKHHKQLGLQIAAGDYTPKWLYEAGGVPFDLSWGSNQMTFPLPWDDVFLDRWGNMVRELGKRYDKDPALSYVTIGGLGRHYEMFYVKNADDIARFNELGGLQKYKEASKTMIDLYMDAFPRTPVILAIGSPSVVGGVPEVVREIIEYGVQTYPNRFGISSHALHAASSLDYYIMDTVRSYRDTIRTGFQMVSPAADTPRMRGTLQQAVDNGLNFGADFLEIYEPDINNDIYAETLRRANEIMLEGADYRGIVK